MAASGDAFCRDSLGCGTSAGDLYQGPMARGLLGTRGPGSAGGLWPRVCRGHVAWGLLGTHGPGSAGGLWPGVCRGHVAWGLSGTCGPGSAGDLWPGVCWGHVAQGESGTCGLGSAGDLWPGVCQGHVAQGESGICGPGSAGGRSGTRGPTGCVSSAPSFSATRFLPLLSLRCILSLPPAESLSLPLVFVGL